MAKEYSRRSVLGAFGGGTVGAAPQALQSFDQRPRVTHHTSVGIARATPTGDDPGADFLVAGTDVGRMALARYEPDGRAVWRRRYATDVRAGTAAGSFVTRLRGGATGDAPGGTDGS